MPWLINAAQLDKFRKNQKSVIILDASFHLPDTKRDAKQEFLDKHIIDAHFLDLNQFHDIQTDLPNMLIHDEAEISEKLSGLGIRDDYKIILYDNSELHSACRALWMLRVFGHNPNQLYILDGGLKAWEKYNGKIASGDEPSSRKQYTAQFQPHLLRTLLKMKQNLKEPMAEVIDLRHPVRFAGGPEPRRGIRSGHIPGSFSFPYSVFFDKEGYFSPLEKIRKQLLDVSIDVTSPIITLCGSGMTAPILNFILDLMNHPNHALYDGSWSEWGAEKLYPGEISITERPVATCLEKE